MNKTEKVMIYGLGYGASPKQLAMVYGWRRVHLAQKAISKFRATK